MTKIAVILALPIEYNTSSMIRCRSIITELGNMGNNIECYCPYYDENSKYYSNKTISIPNLEIVRYGKRTKTVDVTSIKHFEKRSMKSILKKIILKVVHRVDVFGATLLYLPERKKIAEDIRVKKFDILLSFSDPMPAHMIAKFCKEKNPDLYYIQQWGDPLASDTISKVAQPVWFRKMIENSLLSPANKVCYVSPFTCDEQKILFPSQSSKMFFLPTPSLEYEEGEKHEGRIKVGYFGSYNSAARNLKPFYEAACKMEDIDFYIIGDSDIHLKSTENVTVISRMTPDEIKHYMNKIDVIVCLMNLKGNQIPGKIYHDASSTKDIMLIKDGEYGEDIQKFFSKFNHYTFVENNVQAICDALNNYCVNGVPIRKPVDDFRAYTVARELISLW